MNDEWVELTGISPKGVPKYCCFRRDQIVAVYEEGVRDNNFYGCLISVQYATEETKTIMIAGEYDIVRDEITGGKWSRKMHYFHKEMELRRKVHELQYPPKKQVLESSDIAKVCDPGMENP